VFQDIDTIYLAHNSKAFVLNDFEHLDFRYASVATFIFKKLALSSLLYLSDLQT
jgi:hypothetical protein